MNKNAGKYVLGLLKDSLILSSRKLNKQPLKYYLSVGLFFLLLFTVLSLNYFQYNNSITSSLAKHLGYLSVICLLLYQYTHQIKKTRKAEKKADTLELRFQNIYDSGVIGLLYVKLDGQIVEINQTFLALTGNEQEMTAQKQANWNFLSFGDNKDIIGIPIESLKTNGFCAPFEKEYLRMDGKRIPLLVTSFMLQENEQADAIICVLDITQNRFEDQKALQRNKDEFLGIASHELKTPITGVQASLQMLDKISAKDNKLTAPQIRPFIGVANRQIKKLSRLVNQLLDGHKIQSGKMRLNLTEYIFQDSLRDCLKEIGSYGNNQKVTIDGNSPIRIKADRMRIEQVIHSLLSNAIKYSPESSTIHIKIDKLPQGLKFSVADHGIGIPEAKQPHIFEKFSRAHEFPQKYSGLGLDLYISSQIIVQHGGKIGVESEEGNGSTFWFVLPVAEINVPENV